MTYHPILFNDESIRSVLAGRKTQTRRVVRQQPEVGAPLQRLLPYKLNTRQYWGYGTANGQWLADDRIQCPYGQPGDRLWVREEWALATGQLDDGCAVQYRADSAVRDFYRVGVLNHYGEMRSFSDGWRRAMFMPRWASRITLEVTAVRVQRVQEISGMDAKREGAPVPAHIPHDGADCDWAMRWFREAWNALNAKRGYGWSANPWVWVIEFRRAALGEE